MAGPDETTVHILGAGAIGCAFAATFLDSGASVTLAEPDAKARQDAAARVEEQSRAIEAAGLQAKWKRIAICRRGPDTRGPKRQSRVGVRAGTARDKAVDLLRTSLAIRTRYSARIRIVGDPDIAIGSGDRGAGTMSRCASGKSAIGASGDRTRSRIRHVGRHGQPRATDVPGRGASIRSD